MLLALSLAICAFLGLLVLCWCCSGVILFPPEKSPLAVYPERYGLRYDKFSFDTKDGLTLKGWFIPSSTGDKRTILMCHGWGDNKGHLLERTHFLNSASGFNLLYFDHRSHGESEGEITTIGYLELIDFEAALDYLKAQKPQCLERLGVFGLSMGGAVGVMAMARHPEIKAAVIESPFTDYRTVVRTWAWNRFRIPYFPIVMLTLLILRWRVGHNDVDSYSPIRVVSSIAPRPLMMIGGSLDALMPESEVRELYEKAGQPKELWIIPGADHAQCFKVAGLEFESRVAGFFKKNL